MSIEINFNEKSIFDVELLLKTTNSFDGLVLDIKKLFSFDKEKLNINKYIDDYILDDIELIDNGLPEYEFYFLGGRFRLTYRPRFKSVVKDERKNLKDNYNFYIGFSIYRFLGISLNREKVLLIVSYISQLIVELIDVEEILLFLDINSTSNNYIKYRKGKLPETFETSNFINNFFKEKFEIYDSEEMKLSYLKPFKFFSENLFAIGNLLNEEIILSDFISLKKLDQSVENLTVDIISEPNNHKLYYDRGFIYHEKSDYDKAIADYSKAIELSSIEIYLIRGLAYYENGDYDKAIMDYSKIINVIPNNIEAYYNRGNLYYEVGKYNKAIEDFNKLIEMDSNNTEYYYKLSCLYSLLGNKDKSLIFLEKTIKLEPEKYKEKIQNDKSFNNIKSCEEFKKLF